MIHVVYDREHFRVTVKGHAGSAEKGQDLVCAAASILTATLAADVASASGCMRGVPNIELKDGDALISCEPIRKMRSVALMIFDGVCTGFDILAKKHPENIFYEVRG